MRSAIPEQVTAPTLAETPIGARIALLGSLAVYLKRASEQVKFNLRKTSGANFSRIVLAAAYAQQNRMDDVAHVVATIQRIDPIFDPQEFGTKFLNSVNLEHLRDGLRKAGLLTSEAGRSH